MDDSVDVGPELDNLQNRLELDLQGLEKDAGYALNTLIYQFERFLDKHKRYEETKQDLLNLKCKQKILHEGDEDEE